MLLVIPVSPADKKLIPAFEIGFKNFSPGSGHKLLIVGTPQVEADALGLSMAIGKEFSQVSTFITPADNSMGWPIAMNSLFFQAVRHIEANYTAADAFLWMELDSAPLKQGWLTTIQQEYFADAPLAQKEGREFRSFMGVEVITRQTGGGFVKPVEETGTHMAASGVYPQDAATRIPILQYCQQVAIPFAEYVQYYTVPHLNRSKLIQHNWMTKNYRHENGQIISDSCSRFAFSTLGVHYNEPISPEAVFVHGIKDGSLQALLSGHAATVVKQEEVRPMESCLTNIPELQVIPESTLAEPNPVLFNDNLAEIEQKYDYFPEGKGTVVQDYEPLPIEDSLTITTFSDQKNWPTTGFDTEFIRRRDDEQRAKEAAAEPITQEQFIQQRTQQIETRIVAPVAVEAPVKFVKTRTGRGPGRPKKIKRQISDEERQRRADKMREVAAIAHKMRAEKKVAQQLQEVNA